MIIYMAGKLDLNSIHFTRGLVKYVPGRGYFLTVLFKNGDKFATSPKVQGNIFLPPASDRRQGRASQGSSITLQNVACWQLYTCYSGNVCVFMCIDVYLYTQSKQGPVV